MIKRYVISILLLAFCSHSNATECKAIISDILAKNGYGSYDQPNLNKNTMYNGSVVQFGDKKKNGFIISYRNSSTPEITIGTENALGTQESETLLLDENCNIKQLSQVSDFGSMKITSHFCNKFGGDKAKLMGKPSLAKEDGASLGTCYSSRLKAYSACERYSGKFAKSTISSTAPKQESVDRDGAK